MPVNPEAFRASGTGIDLSTRLVQSTTVVASPAAAAQTTICTLTIPANLSVALGVILVGFAAFTVGTNGVSVNLQLRQTDTSGTVVGATGAVTAVAANLGALSVLGFDSSPTLPGQVYVLTMTVASGSAASTVSKTQLVALIV